jgi:hypothetical protein
VNVLGGTRKLCHARRPVLVLLVKHALSHAHNVAEVGGEGERGELAAQVARRPGVVQHAPAVRLVAHQQPALALHLQRARKELARSGQRPQVAAAVAVDL